MNIKSSEIRIGNLIEGASREKPVTVTAAIIKLIDEGKGVYNGITLNEEWLIKFGFTRHSEFDNHWTKERFTVWQNPGSKRIGVFRIGDDIMYLDFVHDLQNCYYYNQNKTELEIL